MAAAIALLLAAAIVPLFAEGRREAAPQQAEPAKEISGIITIFHAGSLSVPFEAMEKEFEAMHPAVDIRREAGGSQACARKITDLGKDCDIMVSADYMVIDELLMPDYPEWNIRFSTNQMVLCYTENSAYADTINADN